MRIWGLDYSSLIVHIDSIRKHTNTKNEGVNEVAASIVGRATERSSHKKKPAAVALGKLGGPKGGRTRAKKLSPEKRKEITQNAARARWGKGI